MFSPEQEQKKAAGYHTVEKDPRFSVTGPRKKPQNNWNDDRIFAQTQVKGYAPAQTENKKRHQELRQMDQHSEIYPEDSISAVGNAQKNLYSPRPPAVQQNRALEPAVMQQLYKHGTALERLEMAKYTLEALKSSAFNSNRPHEREKVWRVTDLVNKKLKVDRADVGRDDPFQDGAAKDPDELTLMQILKLGEFEDNFNASSFRFKKSTHQNASQSQGLQLPFERAVLVGGDACDANLDRSSAVQNLPCVALSSFSS